MSDPDTHFHAVVWMDHREARIFHFSAEDADKVVIHPDRPSRHLHHKAGSVGAGKAGEDRRFFAAIEKELAGAGAVLLTGPGAAKHEFRKHAQAHAPQLARRIVGVETLDHPSDGQLLGHARTYFKAADRMTPQRPA